MITPASLYPYATSLSVLIQLVLLPVLGAVVDTSGRKRELLGATAYLGAFATMGLYFAGGRPLPARCSPVRRGQCRVRGLLSWSPTRSCPTSPRNGRSATLSPPEAGRWATWASALLLTLNLVPLFLQRSELRAWKKATRCVICMMSAGVWWAIFTIIPPVARLRNGLVLGSLEDPAQSDRCGPQLRATVAPPSTKSARLPPHPAVPGRLHHVQRRRSRPSSPSRRPSPTQALKLDQSVPGSAPIPWCSSSHSAERCCSVAIALTGSARRRPSWAASWCGPRWSRWLPCCREGAAVQFFALGFFHCDRAGRHPGAVAVPVLPASFPRGKRGGVLRPRSDQRQRLGVPGCARARCGVGHHGRSTTGWRSCRSSCSSRSVSCCCWPSTFPRRSVPWGTGSPKNSERVSAARRVCRARGGRRAVGSPSPLAAVRTLVRGACSPVWRPGFSLRGRRTTWVVSGFARSGPLEAGGLPRPSSGEEGMRGVAERRRAPGWRTCVAGTEDPPNVDAAGPLFRTPCSRAAIPVRRAARPEPGPVQRVPGP